MINLKTSGVKENVMINVNSFMTFENKDKEIFFTRILNLNEGIMIIFIDKNGHLFWYFDCYSSLCKILKCKCKLGSKIVENKEKGDGFEYFCDVNLFK